jgi:hypothetical protein
VAGSLPLAVGVDRGHPQWPDLSFLFFSPEKSPEVAAGGGVHRRKWAAGGGRWRHPSPEVGGDYLFGCLLIWCFDFIFSLYLFEMVEVSIVEYN